MKTRRLGQLEVSAQGLGCMTMTGTYGEGDPQEATATLHRALDLGVNFLDTSNAYSAGANEKLIGAALKGRRDEVVLATKFGIEFADGFEPTIRNAPDYMRQCLEGSLQRLGVDHIDLYYVHRVDFTVPIEETVGALAEQVQAGKIGHIGLSEAPVDLIRRAHAVHPIAALQSEWSLWSRDIEDEHVAVCRELGIGLVPFSPLGRGMLTGALSKADISEGDYRTTHPRFAAGNFDLNQALVAKLGELAERRGVTTSQLALAWVQNQGADVVPIPGTKRRKYLEQNVAAADLALSSAELVEIEAVFPADAVAGPRYGAKFAKLSTGE
ncbi:aldo/keto reductase [Pseudonocardiaceae bacterium YIM PH 21723]|nr:aldo/keto reductase [Pseudonocardiaceae bacterium YIM PH 21723]